MSILIDENTKVVVQGLTGREGQFHALRNRDYGTKIVAGTRPGKGGENVEGIPIFDDVEKAVSETNANVALTFVPPASFANAGGTKVKATFAFVFFTAFSTSSNIGIPSTFSPPFPGLVPATIFVP